jgi:hypothetical protein
MTGVLSNGYGRKTIVALVQKKSAGKDVQGVLLQSRAATTADGYTLEISGERAGGRQFDPSRVEDEGQASGQ